MLQSISVRISLLTTKNIPVSVPFESVIDGSTEKFKSPLFMGTCQSALSSVSALLYLFFRRKSGQTLTQLLGLHHPPAGTVQTNGSAKANGDAKSNGNAHSPPKHVDSRYSTKALLLRYLQCSVFITSAAPFGFAALSYITYPAMVLGKSCKLVPVMIMNVLLYRRRFAPHKYLVVAMVTLGITMFMGFGKEKPSKAKNNGSGELSMYTQLIGITYLLINLAIDGATNSTQDEIFARFKVSGQQMMFWINLFCTILTSVISILPLPYIPVLHPSHSSTELEGALTFIRTHPSVILPLAQFAVTGALGQLFIFETLQHFGSLTLVYVIASPSTLPSSDTIVPGYDIQNNYSDAQAFHYATLCCCLQPHIDAWPMGRSGSRVCWHLCRGLGKTKRYVHHFTIALVANVGCLRKMSMRSE